MSAAKLPRCVNATQRPLARQGRVPSMAPDNRRAGPIVHAEYRQALWAGLKYGP
jgi:hypothetical protein